MISQTVEYALRAAIVVADNNEDNALTSQEIAEKSNVPPAYLSKVLQQLVKSAIMESQRGLNGGYVLTKSPREISMYDVMHAVEPFDHYHECPLKFMTHDPKLCPLHRRLEATIVQIEENFKKTTLAQILTENPTNPPLCGSGVSGAV